MDVQPSSNAFGIIIITHAEYVASEERFLARFLEMGASAIYVRKEKYSRDYLNTTFQYIPEKYHNRIILPGPMASKIGDGKAMIHVKERNRNNFSQRPLATPSGFSTSIHDLKKWPGLNSMYRLAFYSPVFESISKPGYTSKIPIEELKVNIGNIRSENKTLASLIALGGVSHANVSFVKDAGFDGAALLGSIWSVKDPIQAFTLVLEKIR